MIRLARILAGYFAASLVAAIIVPVSFALFVMYLDAPASTFGGGPAPVPSSKRPHEWWSVFRSVAQIMSIYVSVFAVLAAPVALPAILFAEYRFIQSPAYYGSIGFLAGGLPAIFTYSVGFILVFGLLGVLPGLSYWLISGRKAGE